MITAAASDAVGNQNISETKIHKSGSKITLNTATCTRTEKQQEKEKKFHQQNKKIPVSKAENVQPFKLRNFHVFSRLISEINVNIS